MVTEKQITAVLVVIGAGVAFTFAVFNCYLIFKNSTTTIAKKQS